MEKQNKESFGNDHYQMLFTHALYNVFQRMRQRRDIVCMKCRRFTRAGNIPNNDCCRKLGFAVDPKSVVIDMATGLVTQAAPAIRMETSEDA